MSTEYEKKMLEKMDEMIKWTKLNAKPRIRELVNNNLSDELEYAIYELSDGVRSTRDISAMINNTKSHATVANYWKRWTKLGIVEPSLKYQGRFMKICSLDELGIALPPIKDNITRVEEENP